MDTVRFGIIGVGGMGSSHLKYLPNMPHATVTAVADVDPEKVEKATRTGDVQGFSSAEALLDAKVADAVIIATPHYDHPPIGISALEKGYHVLCEKPIAVGTKAARELIDAASRFPKQKFGIMFNQRSNPRHQKLRELIAEGELGEISRITWIITDWFRTWTYYASGGWRATWGGEGGGVLINQCPHNLDLIQWITGMMPNRVTAVGFIGKTHPIEVEDEMTAVLEYPNGAIGHFITSTGEGTGTNRLEIVGDRGKIVMENGKLMFTRARRSTREVRETSPDSFASIEKWQIDLPIEQAKPGGEHERVTRNFVSAILHDTPMLAPGAEGIHGLEIGNAMIMSAMQKRSVELPVDGAEYEQLLLDLAKQYGGKKTLKTKKVEADLTASSSSFT